MESYATFNVDRHYRYSLTRIWDCQKPRLPVVMLNPSKADEPLQPVKSRYTTAHGTEEQRP